MYYTSQSLRDYNLVIMKKFASLISDQLTLKEEWVSMITTTGDLSPQTFEKILRKMVSHYCSAQNFANAFNKLRIVLAQKGYKKTFLDDCGHPKVLYMLLQDSKNFHLDSFLQKQPSQLQTEAMTKEISGLDKVHANDQKMIEEGLELVEKRRKTLIKVLS